MNIIKIGGILLSDFANYYKFKKFLGDFSRPAFVVISAIGKTTRLLQKAAYQAFENNYESAVETIHLIKELHLSIVNRIFGAENDVNTQLNNVFIEIQNLIKGISITRELNNKILDKILAKGEILSSIIVFNYLIKNNFPVSLLNANDYIITDNNFGSANPIIEETKKRLENLEIQNKIYLIAGFYGSTLNGATTTMGYESSNLTAALLASVFDVDSITIITDVDCIYSADPKLIQNPIPVERINSRTAKLLSKFGLKLIHNQMIDVIENKDIILKFTSLDNTLSTLVSNSVQDVSTPIICFNDNIESDITNLSLPIEKPKSFVAIANVNNALLMRITDFLGSRNLSFAMTYSNKSNFLLVFFSQQLASEISQQLHEIIVIN